MCTITLSNYIYSTNYRTVAFIMHKCIFIEYGNGLTLDDITAVDFI